MRAFRIADRRFPIFDATGARLTGGRWNSPGNPVIYAAETFSGAVLEVLVHANLGRLPAMHALIEISIPDGVTIESVKPPMLPGWDAPALSRSREFGDQWLVEARSVVLLVPSLVTRGRELNVLLNPNHAEFGAVTASKPQPMIWDERLFLRRRR